MNLLLANTSDKRGDQLHIEGRRALHIRNVLQAKVGDRIVVGMVREGQGSAEVLSIVHNQVVLGDLQIQAPATVPSLRLIIALPRPKALRRLLQTAASFGVDHIEILNAWRVHKSYWNSPLVELAAMKEELWLGCEQGRHSWLPTIGIERYFVPYVEGLSEQSGAKLLAHPGTRVWLDDLEPTAGTTTIAIGPEGGWIEREVESFTQVGFHSFTISDSILRSEIALAATLAQWQMLARNARM